MLTPKPPSLEYYLSKCAEHSTFINKVPISNVEPLISIITIVLNSERTLEQTIQSVIRQNYSHVEYIIIDGGSTDRSLEIMKKYDSKVKYWLSEKDEGISDAMNKGIALSHGSLIGIIHADDWYEENILSKVVLEHKNTPEAIIHGNIRYWKNDTSQYVAIADDSKLLRHMTVHHPTMFIPRSVYESIGLYRTEFHFAMDHEWAMRAKTLECRFSYLNEVLSNMRIYGQSDKNWYKAFIESAKARSILGVPIPYNIYVTCVTIVISFVRRSFEFFGLAQIVSLYRKHFSVIKKFN